MNNKTMDMTTGTPAGLLIRFSIPLIITNMGQQLYMIADGAIVGRGVGVKALASVGATDWCYWLILWTIGGLTQGFSTFVARAFGEKNNKELNKTIATSATLCLLIGLSLTILGLLAAKPVLRLLHTPDDIISGASAYLMTMVCGTLIVIAYNMSAAILRALGDSKSPLVAMAVAAVVNIGLDCLFVFVFKWGIIGAAVASLIAQMISFLYCLNAIRKIDCIHLDKSAWTPDYKKLKDMVVFGLPIATQYIVITLGGMILQSSVNLQGSYFIAGYTATNKLYALLQCFGQSFGFATSTYVAQNYGAGLHKRVEHGVNTATKITVSTAVAISILSIVTSKYTLQVFLDVNEAGGQAALDAAVRYLVIMAACFIILHILHEFRNVLLALGVSIWSMLSGFAELIARILLAKILIQSIGTDALFIAEPASWLGAMLCAFPPYFYYRKKLLRGNNNTNHSSSINNKI